jgi:hypothetical protein
VEKREREREREREKERERERYDGDVQAQLDAGDRHCSLLTMQKQLVITVTDTSQQKAHACIVSTRHNLLLSV